MTKTAIIEYNEADEALIQLLFLKISVKFKKTKKVKLSKKERFAKEFREALEECNAIHRGERKPVKTYEQFKAELKAISDANHTIGTV